uniref:Uncharacterized protein n=1 Tax=Triticum urartu TaxID=4572 RepID=A0A8R7TTN8_TRIUA
IHISVPKDLRSGGRAGRHDVAGVHVAAARRPAAAGAGAEEHAARSVPGGDTVHGGIQGPQRSSYMQPRQAAEGGHRAEAPVVRHRCCKRPPFCSYCCCKDRHDGSVHKGGSGGVRSVDASQKRVTAKKMLIRKKAPLIAPL